MKKFLTMALLLVFLLMVSSTLGQSPGGTGRPDTTHPDTPTEISPPTDVIESESEPVTVDSPHGDLTLRELNDVRCYADPTIRGPGTLCVTYFPYDCVTAKSNYFNSRLEHEFGSNREDWPCRIIHQTPCFDLSEICTCEEAESCRFCTTIWYITFVGDGNPNFCNKLLNDSLRLPCPAEEEE